MQFAKPKLPPAHEIGEGSVDQHQRLGLGALVRIERPKHVFGGKRDMVVAERHVPRHSRISSMLRRSQVLIVFTGFSRLAANCSRLQPF